MANIDFSALIGAVGVELLIFSATIAGLSFFSRRLEAWNRSQEADKKSKIKMATNIAKVILGIKITILGLGAWLFIKCVYYFLKLILMNWEEEPSNLILTLIIKAVICLLTSILIVWVNNKVISKMEYLDQLGDPQPVQVDTKVTSESDPTDGSGPPGSAPGAH